ncbi:MAG: cytochrome c-type biogenesis protein CcmH [Albidovulum sp.]|nr:cytochrome c-type biogenesis protein CcmH [Albidovulum sp.]
MKWLAVALSLLAATMSAAVEPGEILEDPRLEARAREISSNLRCLICRNESIDDSNAELASDLRRIVREQLRNGKDDSDIYDFVVDRYGEFVLLRPNLKGANILLYASGPIILLIGTALCALYIRQRRKPSRQKDALRDDERERLEQILGQ